MQSELLKTIFIQNGVGFRNVDYISDKKHVYTNMSKQSQIDYSVLSNGCKIFIALNPATHKFDLSQLNKITGEKLSYVKKEEVKKINFNLLKAMPHNLKNEVRIYIDDALEYQDELFVVDENKKRAFAINVNQLIKLSSDN